LTESFLYYNSLLFFMVLGRKGQGAIEYLLIIGAAIIVVAVVIVAITSVSNTGKEQLSDAGVSHTNDPLKEASGNYIKISNYYYPKTELGNGLVGLWHFDEGSGTVTTVSSGKGNTGALTNIRGILANNPLWVGGKFGAALSFRSGDINSYVNVGSGASLNIPGDITIEAWVNPAISPEVNHAGIFVGRGPGGSGSEDYSLVVAGNSVSLPYNNRLGFNYCAGPNCANWYDAASWSTGTAGELSSGAWAQVVVTRNISDGKIRYYKNGILMDAAPGVGAGLGQLTNPKVIGADTAQGGNGYFAGLIDEVAVWNRALSDAEIQSLYANSQ
jgi:hypothetical protein